VKYRGPLIILINANLRVERRLAERENPLNDMTNVELYHCYRFSRQGLFYLEDLVSRRSVTRPTEEMHCVPCHNC